MSPSSRKPETHLTTKQYTTSRTPASRFGAYNIRIFGSTARGQAGTESDIDILVDLEPGRSLLDLGGLLMDLQELLDCPVDVVTEKGLRPQMRQRVIKEAVPLFPKACNAPHYKRTVP